MSQLLKLLLSVVAAVFVPLVMVALFKGAPKPALTSAVPAAVTVSWQKVEPHLDRLDQESAAIAERQLSRISAFLNEKKKRGAKAFADAAFSWTAKFNLVVGKVQGDDGARLRRYLQEQFELNVFKSEELQDLLESVIAGVATECGGAENQALFQIRVDIAEDELFKGTLPPLQTDQAFQEEYQRLSEQMLPTVLTDLHVGVASQATNFAASEVAARQFGPGLAQRLGISGSGFWSSVGRSATVIGVGVVAWWALEKIFDWLMDLFGYGPAAELAGKVQQSLNRLESQLINGDPAAVADYEQLRQQERDSPTADAQEEFRQGAERIEQSGTLGLRREFRKLLELQSRLRREALFKLVTAQGGQ